MLGAWHERERRQATHVANILAALTGSEPSEFLPQSDDPEDIKENADRLAAALESYAANNG